MVCIMIVVPLPHNRLLSSLFSVRTPMANLVLVINLNFYRNIGDTQERNSPA